jgi:hypothetical protein
VTAEAKANLERLTSCPGPHRFFTVERTQHRAIRRRYRCARCGGVVDGVQRYWYELGLEHARRGADAAN